MELLALSTEFTQLITEQILVYWLITITINYVLLFFIHLESILNFIIYVQVKFTYGHSISNFQKPSTNIFFILIGSSHVLADFSQGGY